MQELDKFKNQMNLSGKNVYVGHRYVPKIFGEWNNENIYEPLSIVQYQGASYTSRQYVPVGVEITNKDFWALSGNYNAQVEHYRKNVSDMEESVNKNVADMEERVTDNLDFVKDSLEENELKVAELEYKTANYGGRNVLNKDELFERTRINAATGEVFTEMQYTSSDKIYLLPSKTYIIYDTEGHNITNVGIVFYDNNDDRIDGLYFDESQKEIVFNTLSEFEYVRITARTDRYWNDGRMEDFKIQLGSTVQDDLETKIEKIAHRLQVTQNSDSAITKLINTGLTYAKMPDLVYGNDFTPYSYSTQKNGSGFYELDCSSFAQVAMNGVNSDVSRYYKSRNYSGTWNNDLFNHNRSDGRFLANKLAEYAYNNGYLFEANEDFSNVQAGDVFFHYNAKNSDGDFWRMVGHNGFIIDIKGTNPNKPSFDVLECGGDTQGIRPANNPVGINRYTYDEFVRIKKTYIFARFPMNNIENQTRDITRDHFSTARDLAANVELQEYKIYTAFVKVSNKGTAYPLLRLNGKQLVSAHTQNYSELNEQMFRMVFYIPTGLLTGENDFITLLFNNSDTEVLEYKALYEGFVTEPFDYDI